jgi:hypothetical protein
MSVFDSFESGQLRSIEERLIARFSPPLRPEDVRRCLAESVVGFEDARVRMYLLVLVERAATDRLQACVRRGNGMAGGPGRDAGQRRSSQDHLASEGAVS